VAAAICVGVGAFLLVSALAGGGSNGGGGGPSSSGASATVGEGHTPAPLAEFQLHSPHVRSEVQVYSLQGVAGGTEATPPPDTAPVAATEFQRPIATYRAYAIGQLRQMEPEIAALEHALTAGQREAAKSDWRAAYADYLRLGAVYLDGQTALDARVAHLNLQIDGTPGGLPGGVSSPRFTGLHRIEYGLWTGASPQTLAAEAHSLATHVRELATVLPRAEITPLEYATRAHEILEDAARDFLSGMDVPWSGEGVLATDAGLQATERVLATLSPVLGTTERVIPTVDTELAQLRSAFAVLAADHGGQLPSNDELSQEQAEQLDGTLQGALEALSQVPGVLETEPPPKIPRIPPKDFKVNPLDL
jgi:iron uptake system EfeUOB component EfeO/EfeM